MLTVGAAPDHDGVINVGVAAHITAASPGGPRFDGTISAEVRADQANGIWLCQTHAKLIDSDSGYYTVEILRNWKRAAEARSFALIVSGQAGSDHGAAASPVADLGSVHRRLVEAAWTDLGSQKRTPRWPAHPINLRLTVNEGGKTHNFDAVGLAAAAETFRELILLAAPGTGKTTTLIQVTEGILSAGRVVAVYFPLNEWGTQPGTLFHSVLQRKAFLDSDLQQLGALADEGRLILVLDGWNELDSGERQRAKAEIHRLRREYPELGVIISTRAISSDLPFSGPVATIDALEEAEQLQIARALRGNNGEALLDHAWRTAGLRDLVPIPLYLTVLITKAHGGRLPTTKEEVLGLFVEEYEAKAAQSKELLGFHGRFLGVLAVAATQAGKAALTEAEAKAVIKVAEDDLLSRGQISSTPQPGSVLSALVDLHALVLFEGGERGFRFQHQQFQEWYASFEVESIMLLTADGDVLARARLREACLNMRPWEEAVLFACERLSRAGQAGINAVVGAVHLMMEIDPMLAAAAISRSSDELWNKIRGEIINFVVRWHVKGQVDRAVHFMMGSGRSDFAEYIWPLITDSDSQIHLAALRAGRGFKPSILGSDAKERIACLPAGMREILLSEIVFRGGREEVEFGAGLAREDKDPKVEGSVIGALLFRRADLLAIELIRIASNDACAIVAQKGYIEEVQDGEASDRLRRALQAEIHRSADPLVKLRAVVNAGARPDFEDAVASLIQDTRFPVRSEGLGHLLWDAHRVYPGAVASGLRARLEKGLDVPFESHSLLGASRYVVEDGPIVNLVLHPSAPAGQAVAAAAIIGPRTVGLLLVRYIAAHNQLLSLRPRGSPGVEQEYVRLGDLIAATPVSSFVQAISTATASTPHEIALLSDLVSRHGRKYEEPIAGEESAYVPLAGIIVKWGEAILSSAEAKRSQYAMMARAIDRAASPELLSTLQRLLTADLARWTKEKEELRAARERGIRLESEAHYCTMNQYRAALVAIGGDAVVQFVTSRLADRDFGFEAACVLKALWDKTQQTKKDKGFANSDFSESPSKKFMSFYKAVAT
jgi:hypothetical protein